MIITVQKRTKKEQHVFLSLSLSLSLSHPLKDGFQYAPVPGVFIMPRLLMFPNPKAKKVCSFLEKIRLFLSSLYFLFLIVYAFIYFLLRSCRLGEGGLEEA